MTDKQIDINNQVEVGLNIAKELLELHKMFEDEVEKSPYFIQTNFIKNKLFYFYQRADWLNVCFNLLDKQLQAKEQECEELKIYIESNEQQVKEVETLVMDNDRLINELDQLNEDRIEALKQLEFVRTLNTVQDAEIRKLSKTLAEIKEIAYELTNEKYTDFIEGKQKQILQKISECEGNQ